MAIIMLYMIISLLLMVLLSMGYLLISIKNGYMRTKFSTFECGMDLMSQLRLPFSLHFYFISIVFLIFDVELMLILPFVYCMKILSISEMMIMTMSLAVVLSLGFVYEWWTGLLNWMI
uniref:NADH-ubiquinone oxidoreductase chain 3 n=1 Tax=Bemisia sp. PB-2004 TaxID=267824 RepID=Q697F3_9HEMI|nr:NADH dehydrogenase subunit 3 [Bemisia sp. PB-2004]